jgi:hypothetical protein
MWMSAYIQEIQRQLVEVYGLPENPDMPGVPMSVPDGDYPMTIDDKVDRVEITNGTIDCCNFEA